MKDYDYHLEKLNKLKKDFKKEIFIKGIHPSKMQIHAYYCMRKHNEELKDLFKEIYNLKD